MGTSEIGQNTTRHVSARLCGRRSAQEQGASAVVLTRPRGTYYWSYASGDKATTGIDEAGTPSPAYGVEAVEEGKSEVRRELCGSGPLLAKRTKVKKGNSRFVHACTNHV
jgi:hypothetical protein